MARFWNCQILVFVGFYEHAIDAKHRLAIPAEIRSQLAARDPQGQPVESPVFLYVTFGEGESLCLYTEEGFQKRADDLDRSELDSQEVLEYEEMMFGTARRVEMDRQGRVRLPDELLSRSGLGTDVVLVGMKDHLQIRDRSAWLTKVAQVRQQRPELFRNPRQLLRRPRRDSEAPQEEAKGG